MKSHEPGTNVLRQEETNGPQQPQVLVPRIMRITPTHWRNCSLMGWLTKEVGSVDSRRHIHTVGLARSTVTRAAPKPLAADPLPDLQACLPMSWQIVGGHTTCRRVPSFQVTSPRPQRRHIGEAAKENGTKQEGTRGRGCGTRRHNTYRHPGKERLTFCFRRLQDSQA